MTRPMNRLTASACVGTIFLAGAANSRADSWRHMPSTLCVGLGDSGPSFSNATSSPSFSGIGEAYNAASSTMEWMCPVMDDSTFPVNDGGASSTSYQLWGHQNTAGAVSATDCDTYYGGGGFACETTARSSGAAGVWHIAGTTGTASSPWHTANAADTKWLLVTIAGATGTSPNLQYNTLYGYGYDL